MTKSKQRVQVLLVEDDPATRKKLERRLKKSGFDVKPTASYAEAFAAFKAGFFDVVIADWDLDPDSKKKGDALFQALRKRDWEVPLILVSGKLTEEWKRARTLQEVISLGPARFVEAGEGYEPILEAVRELLARRDLLIRNIVDRLRRAQAHGDVVETTAGSRTPEQILADLLKVSAWKDKTLSPIAEDFAKWELTRRRKRPS